MTLTPIGTGKELHACGRQPAIPFIMKTLNTLIDEVEKDINSTVEGLLTETENPFSIETRRR
jgi:hypothetical protein